ncbi:Single-stranded DNA-binding protein 3 [Fukomys damarensis]|uniref:Single-stranded DNA-binding protein 3 n=1 Tax=Fukomys damarensis TaxID=885580 RepID=A0A091CTR0_FUKDA|nr:Single-stranded DNA-binding protein 3 [Fukomys damarensis]
MQTSEGAMSLVVGRCGAARLALYVYEYLLHVGAQKSAQTFLSESAAAAPSPVLGNIPPNDGMPGGPIPPGFFQTDPWLSLQNYGSGMRPPPNSLGPAMPGINMGPGAGRPWPNPNSANSIPYSSSSPGTYVGPPGGGGPPGTPIMPSPADSTNSSDNIYTMINPVPPGGSRSNFPMGPGSDGPMGGMGGMEPHHMNGSLGSGDIDGLPKNSPNNISGISNPPGTPRDDSELGGNFLHSFQNDNQELGPQELGHGVLVENEGPPRSSPTCQVLHWPPGPFTQPR